MRAIKLGAGGALGGAYVPVGLPVACVSPGRAAGTWQSYVVHPAAIAGSCCTVLRLIPPGLAWLPLPPCTAATTADAIVREGDDEGAIRRMEQQANESLRVGSILLHQGRCGCLTCLLQHVLSASLCFCFAVMQDDMVMCALVALCSQTRPLSSLVNQQLPPRPCRAM